ncbi:MAG: hypothetical protein MUO82_09990 [Candidatus Thermoplasmatota archaeon]|nr:hypothetical protein [Candidatus Thermoplasmatota archaeon]
MVKVTVELSKLEILMLMNSIDAAIDLKHAKKTERLKEIKNQFSKYL